jgi:hypothetical protein
LGGGARYLGGLLDLAPGHLIVQGGEDESAEQGVALATGHCLPGGGDQVGVAVTGARRYLRTTGGHDTHRGVLEFGMS